MFSLIVGRDARWLLLVLVALSSPLLACRQGAATDTGYRVEISVSPERPSVGPADITVRLSDGSGAAVKGATVEVEGNMSHAGMVPVLADAREVAPGRYEADLRFTMAGDWVILVRAALPDGRSLERSFDVRGVRREA